jgi:ABC-2 type transport system permease protein
MKNLFRIEWLKVRYYKAFWILLGFFVVSIVGLNYIAYSARMSADDKAGKVNSAAVLGHPFSFPDVWQAVSYMSGFLLFVPGLIVITLITNEFTYRTHRQNIIDGWTRTQFVAIKLIWVLLLALVATLSVIGTALLFGSMGNTPVTSDKLEYAGYFFVEALNYIALALLLGTVIKRAGLAIGLLILYILIFKNVFSWLADYHNNSHIGNFLPLNVADKLINFPIVKDLSSLFAAPGPSTWVLLTGSILYLFLYGGLLIWKFNNDDL